MYRDADAVVKVSRYTRYFT